MKNSNFNFNTTRRVVRFSIYILETTHSKTIDCSMFTTRTKTIEHSNIIVRSFINIKISHQLLTIVLRKFILFLIAIMSYYILNKTHVLWNLKSIRGNAHPPWNNSTNMTIIIIYYEQSQRNDFAIESTGCDHILDCTIVWSTIKLSSKPAPSSSLAFFIKNSISRSSVIVTSVLICLLLSFCGSVFVVSVMTMWFTSTKFRILASFVLTAAYGIAKCDPIANKNFNSNIRDYAATDVNVSERRNFQNKLRGEMKKLLNNTF